ncbi:hypothetical protein [Pedobacter cryotolerans]|uniref:hypothetical protein n=1 Tax=Pedobacter cryotolerans TaxID=2571270 RepID=UPI00197CCB63|nr:hypothetical protein [Pedobacter cryotolerans]
MALFKKRNHRFSEETLTDHIANYVNQRQRKLADYLNIKTRHASGSSLLYGLIIFCTVFGSYLLYLLTSAFGAYN